MARNKPLTDEQVEEEIARLQQSKYVQIADYEQKRKYQRRQRLYQLRWLEKRGRQIAGVSTTNESMDRHLEMPEGSSEPREKNK